jgi:hypothetical protein
VREVQLEVDERVVMLESQGLIGVAATSARLLGATSRDSGFRELRLRVDERRGAPARIHLGDRVALVVMHRRVLGLGPGASSWIETELSPQEREPRVHADANVAVAVTPLRAIAFSLASGGFVSEPLTPGEPIERVSIEESSITLLTPRRVLVFRAGSPRWQTLFRTER